MGIPTILTSICYHMRVDTQWHVDTQWSGDTQWIGGLRPRGDPCYGKDWWHLRYALWGGWGDEWDVFV